MDIASDTKTAAATPKGLPDTTAITLIINDNPMRLDVAPWTKIGRAHV